MNTSDLIANLIAGLALILSIIVYFRTGKRLKRLERPSLAIVEQKFINGITNIQISNIGNNPAINVVSKIEIFQKETKEKSTNKEKINEIKPTTGFSFKLKLIKESYYYFLLTYKDAFHKKKSYKDEYFLKTRQKPRLLEYASPEEIENFKSFINKISE